MKILTGNVRRTQVFELDHNICCTDNDCQCETKTIKTTVRSKQYANVRSIKKSEFRAPGTISIGYKQSVVVDDCVLNCAGIKSAIKLKALIVK